MKARFIRSVFSFAAVFLFVGASFAQESEAVVVDEVVAQVNDGVITLSRVKSEMKATIGTLVQQGKTPEAAKAEVESKKAELIANLITEEMIVQKGKDLGFEANVDVQINQRFAQIMKEQNIKTIELLYAEMAKANINPNDLRENWRKQIIRDMVFQREVDQRVYLGWSNKEIKEYYEKNKAKFTKPETVTLSEIFLGFAGRNPEDVRKNADEIIAQARGGADFAKLATEKSDRPDVATTKGAVGTFKVGELDEKVGGAVKNVKAGEIAKFETDEGVEIIRVDSRVAASSEIVFDESAVRSAMTYEKLPDERKKYIADLRKDSYIKIAESYKAMVEPLLPIVAKQPEAKKQASK